MNKTILTLNAGSSSIKFGLYQIEQKRLSNICQGKIEVSGPSSLFQAKDDQGNYLQQAHVGVSCHKSAIEILLKWLETQPRKRELTAIGHRVVHGGTAFGQPILIDKKVVERLQELIPLAPLHQTDSLTGIKALQYLQPDLRQVACFDTAFHRTMPVEEQLYALPVHLADQGVRRYGFHGLSYEYIAQILPTHMGARAEGRIVVAHLGNGASLCALKQRKSVATTMGFTPLEGLPMGTRCGTIDPAVLLYLMREQQMNHDNLAELLHRQSGLLGISGISADMRTLLESNDPRAKQAVNLFIWQTCRHIGALVATLDGIDGLIFTAGIGEHAPQIRARICARLQWLGVKLDEPSNQTNATCISTDDSQVSVLVLPTDEEIIIASHTLKLITESQNEP